VETWGLRFVETEEFPCRSPVEIMLMIFKKHKGNGTERELLAYL
jgi:hypothetical protein